MVFHDSVTTTTSHTTVSTSQESPQLSLSNDSNLPTLPSYDTMGHYILLLHQRMFSTNLNVFTELKAFEEITGFRTTDVPEASSSSIIDKVRNLFSRCGSSNDKRFNNPFNYEILQQRQHDLLDAISKHKDAIKHLHETRKHCEKMERKVLKTQQKFIQMKKKQLSDIKILKTQCVLEKVQTELDGVKSDFYENYLNEMYTRQNLTKMSNVLQLEAICRIEMCVAKLMKYHKQDISAAQIEEYAEIIYRRACDSHKLMVPDLNIVEVLEPCCNEWTGQAYI